MCLVRTKHIIVQPWNYFCVLLLCMQWVCNTLISCNIIIMPLSVYYMPKACITRPKILCLGIIHLFLKKTWMRLRGRQEEKRRRKHFCNKDPLLIFNVLPRSCYYARLVPWFNKEKCPRLLLRKKEWPWARSLQNRNIDLKPWFLSFSFMSACILGKKD